MMVTGGRQQQSPWETMCFERTPTRNCVGHGDWNETPRLVKNCQRPWPSCTVNRFHRDNNSDKRRQRQQRAKKMAMNE